MHVETLRDVNRSNYRLQDVQLSDSYLFSAIGLRLIADV